MVEMLGDELGTAGVDDPLDPMYDLVPEPATTRLPLGRPLLSTAMIAIFTLLRFGPVAAAAAAAYTAGVFVHGWAVCGGEPEVPPRPGRSPRRS